ncbi:hypothetical protein KVR01_003505 [Diaporthe batatas]|uniref:uncharacterized protein n=1 Tax=Diaporthe batatas TaxID=748121 RepID=UPI001D04A1A8|nr:uncharacterized protein KVR01_003505 [Diaporthe batatas]KAG8167816.1 hypothetical protein KVR01_003505 [Diaporthe batatas]
MEASREKPIHQQPKLCEHILSHASKSAVPLRIGASSIPQAGSGLFAVNHIPAGSEIFRSSPLVVVAESAHQNVCDFCFLNRGSSVNRDGQFYGSIENEERPALTRCGACKVSYYCSKTCQTKAWKSYHKRECKFLRDNPRMASLDQALCRLLVWIKHRTLSEDDMRAIVALETKFDAQLEQTRQAAGDEGPGIDKSLHVAQNLHAVVKPGISLSLCRQLYCMLAINCLAIRPPELQIAYGTCLDLVVSLINHCCDENAHIFFEGRELRCRAVKNIAAGTEITVCYQDSRQDVLHRRSLLKDIFFFTCDCSKCKSETAQHIAAAVKRPNYLEILREAQDDLNKVVHKYTLASERSARNIKTIMDYQTELLDIEEKVFQGSNWPDHIEPMPSALRDLGGMYLELKYVVGLEFVLKGTFYSRTQDDPRWVLDLMKLVKYILYLSQERDDVLNWTGAAPPQVLGGRPTLFDTARGYLVHVCLSGKFTFGLDTKYVQALYHWAGNLIERPGDPGIDTKAFQERFKSSQDKLLTWAKMKTGRGLELPSLQVMVGFRKDVAEAAEGDK